MRPRLHSKNRHLTQLFGHSLRLLGTPYPRHMIPTLGIPEAHDTHTRHNGQCGGLRRNNTTVGLYAVASLEDELPVGGREGERDEEEEERGGEIALSGELDPRAALLRAFDGVGERGRPAEQRAVEQQESAGAGPDCGARRGGPSTVGAKREAAAGCSREEEGDATRCGGSVRAGAYRAGRGCR